MPEVDVARSRPSEHDRAPYIPPAQPVHCRDPELKGEERVAPSWICKLLGRAEACANCLPFLLEAKDGTPL